MGRTAIIAGMIARLRRRTVALVAVAAVIATVAAVRATPSARASSRLQTTAAPTPAPRVVRLRGNPIIRPEMLPDADGANINGPSLIRVPT